MITPYEPKVDDKARYSIGEAAELLGIHPNTLLRHAKAGYIKFGIRTMSKNKFFLGYDIRKYWRSQY